MHVARVASLPPRVSASLGSYCCGSPQRRQLYRLLDHRPALVKRGRRHRLPDAAVITSGNNPSTPSNDVIFNVTCPSDVGTITEASLRIRAREQGNSGRTISFAISWSATAATDFSTGALTSSLANYSSGNKTGLSISKSTCDSSTFKVAPTTSGSGPAEKAEIDSFNLDITYTVAANQPPLRRTITLN